MHVNHPQSRRQSIKNRNASGDLDTLTETPCDRCGSHRHECLLDVGDVTLYKCEDCGWRFTRVTPSALELSVALRALRAPGPHDVTPS